jgi:MFS family permease
MTIILMVRVFLPFALGYFFVSIFRSINAVITPDLIRDLDLGATGLGFAVSAFFLSGTLFQLPYGVLLDRYDPRRTYAVCLGLAALGATIAALAQDILLLAAGRALIALGATASAVTSFKVYSLWFPQERLPLVNGLSLAAGGLGLMAGTSPVEAALGFVDWRGIYLIVGVLLLCSAALVPMLAPVKQMPKTGLTLLEQFKGLSDVVGSVAFWRVAPLMTVVAGSFAAFSQLWAGPWIRDVAGLSAPEAANLLLVLAGSMTASGLLTGMLTALGKRIGLQPTEFVVATAGLFALVLVVLFLQWTPSALAVSVTWALFGFVATLSFVSYAALAPHFPPQLTGRLNACLTLSWMLGAFVIQNIYGMALDWFPAMNGAYSAHGHRFAVGVLIILLLAALGWYFVASYFIKLKGSRLTSGSKVRTS